MSVVLVRQPRFDDGRGWFTESWNRARFAGLGIDTDFVQDNHSFSRDAGTVRGLHFQLPPYAQAKLVRCVRGSVFDVAVDIRTGSPTFGQHVGRILSAGNDEQLFIPAGYAHGFMTLEADCEVMYKVSALYNPEAEGGIIWSDRALGIAWPRGDASLSAKDAKLPALAALDAGFAYDGVPLMPLPTG